MKCEKMVTAQDELKWTIVRPTLAYDKSGGQEFVMFTNALLRFPVAFLIGPGQAIKNPVLVDDLIRGFVKLPGNKKAFNKIYSFCGSEEIRVRDLAKLILELHGRKSLLVPIPVWICKTIASIVGRLTPRPPLTWNGILGLTQNANPDWSQARRDLDYNPVGVRQGLRQCVSG
jgi:NADH dehydrogenase